MENSSQDKGKLNESRNVLLPFAMLTHKLISIIGSGTPTALWDPLIIISIFRTERLFLMPRAFLFSPETGWAMCKNVVSIILVKTGAGSTAGHGNAIRPSFDRNLRHKRSSFSKGGAFALDGAVRYSALSLTYYARCLQVEKCEPAPLEKDLELWHLASNSAPLTAFPYWA